MKLFFSILFLSIALALNAQNGAVTSAGENSAKNGMIVNWTIGSTITGSSQTDTKHISTGDIHPLYQIFYQQKENQIQLDCFPNPATKFFNVVLHTNEFEGMTWRLYNGKGETIKTGKLESNQFEIHINSLISASYLLNIYDANKQLVSGAKLLKK
ncbi:MAG: T9SS type A sorting domain-containing protein [Bacteroidales bacterium]|nr:T9SS type A sorting domain-containing protein [Bacteroidales bacterium]